MPNVPIGKDKIPKAYRTPVIIGNPLMKMGLCVYVLLARIILYLREKQCNIGNCGLDRLTETVHSIAMRNTRTLDQLACTYLEEIVRLHGVPTCTVPDGDTRFLSGF